MGASMLKFLIPLLLLPGLAMAGPKVSEFWLKNGMQAVVIEDHRAPVVTHMVWYRVGGADEPPGQSGIAHLFEHMMFKGTKTVPPGQFSKIVASNGGQDNAFTSRDYTAYYQRIAADRLALVMELEADRMRNLIIDDQNFITERAVVLEERSQRVDNHPSAQFNEQLMAALWSGSAYAIPVIGWRPEIEAMTIDNARDFYDRYYAPDNAILVVAGDVNPAVVQALAERYYGPIPPSGKHPAHWVRPNAKVESVMLRHADKRVRQPGWRRMWTAPSYRTGKPGQAEAMEIAAWILGGGPEARLSQALVHEQKIALGANAWFNGVQRGDTEFGISVTPAPGIKPEQLAKAVEAEMARLHRDGPTTEELERAKTVLIAEMIYGSDSQVTMANIYGSALATGLTLRDVQEWPTRLRAVDAAAVKAAIGLLGARRSVTGWLSGEEG